MPFINPSLAAILTLSAALPLYGQSVESRILRSDQNTAINFRIGNDHAVTRDFVVKGLQNEEESWSVIYLTENGTNITNEILSTGGVTLRVPPKQGLTVQIAFFSAGTLEGSTRTTTLTAEPLDGQSVPQSGTFRVRMLSVLTVNDPRDLSDADVSDELLDVDPSTPGEQITLRSALALANQRAGLDRIQFMLPEEHRSQIALQAPLPEVEGPVILDGTTQTAGPVPHAVEITGRELPPGDSNHGLVLTGGGSIIRGLSFTRFRSTEFEVIPNPLPPNPSGIVLKGEGGNLIENCFLGLPPAGEVGAGNEGYGIRIECGENTVSDCHIAGNWVGGVGVFGPEATGNTISATVGGSFSASHSTNFLAPALPFEEFLFSPSVSTLEASFASLDANLSNSSIYFTSLATEDPWESPAAGYLGGIVLHDAPGNQITDCLLQGNGSHGIRILGDATGTLVKDNTAGQRLSPSSLRNKGHGISLECDHAVLEGNETHCNLKSGVFVRGVRNTIRSPHSSGNGECGIHCEGRETLIGGTVFPHRGQLYSNPVGILLSSPSAPVSYVPGWNAVYGNLIGAEAPVGPGTPIPRPNLKGIHIRGSSGNRIGGRTLSGESNSIVYNHLQGILVSEGSSNRLHGNFIDRNGRLDIDLTQGVKGNGRDMPDRGDLDEGGNHRLNPPSLGRIIQNGESLQLTGELPGIPSGRYELEVVISRPTLSILGSHYSEILPLEHTSPGSSFSFTLQSRIDLLGAHIRASLTDSAFNTSEYSHWVRIEEILDRDGDGVSDGVEAESGGGDSNGDGIPDALQAHVASFPTLLTGPLIVTSTAGLSFESILVEALSDFPPLKSQEFPTGIWSFTLGGLSDGGPATVNIHASGENRGERFYCFGPTPENPTPHWYDFSFDGTTGLEVEGDLLILHLVDGARGDHDLTINGQITNRGGSSTSRPAIANPLFQTLSDGSVIVSWAAPIGRDELFLQENLRPDTQPWAFSPDPIQKSAHTYVVRIHPASARMLFRLARP